MKRIGRGELFRETYEVAGRQDRDKPEEKDSATAFGRHRPTQEKKKKKKEKKKKKKKKKKRVKTLHSNDGESGDAEKRPKKFHPILKGGKEYCQRVESDTV